METKQVKDFYNDSLSKSENTYEFNRWQKNSQAKASYILSRQVIEKYALPLIQTGDSVFELGPGPGTWSKLIITKKPESIDLVDISSEMLKQAKANLADNEEKINYVESDILDFEPNKQYDFFFSSRMIEYVPEKERALEKIVKALKPNGHGYIVTKTPHYNRPFNAHKHADFHGNQIKPSELEAILVKCNCTVIKKVHVTCVFPKLRSGFLDKGLTWVLRLLPFNTSSLFSESYAIIFKKNDS